MRRLVRSLRVPFDWRHPRALLAMWRRGYPSPADFERMGPEAVRAYARKIGFGKDIRRSLAELRAGGGHSVEEVRDELRRREAAP